MLCANSIIDDLSNSFLTWSLTFIWESLRSIIILSLWFLSLCPTKSWASSILSDNLNLISSEDSASIYNNVVVNNKNGQLKADKVDYNFESKYYKVSMYKDERIKIKLIEWLT